MAKHKSGSTLALPCPDWIFAYGSNIHVAKDRSWFGDDYTVFQSALGDGTPVEGLGTVSLTVKRSPSSSGRNGHAILRLANVLHVPNATCNILGFPIANEYKLVTDSQDPSKSTIRDAQGRLLAYFRPLSETCQLLALRLSGPPVGPNVGPSMLGHVDTSQTFVHVNAVWPEVERQRWYSRFSSAGSTSVNPAAPPAASTSTPGRKKPHPQSRDTQKASANKIPAAGSSSALGPSRRGATGPQPPPREAEQPQKQNTDKPVIASVEPVNNKLVRVVSHGKETRSCFMFPSLHDDIRAAISEEDIPKIWFNAKPDSDEDNDLQDKYDTKIMGEFKCCNKTCPRGGWHSKKVAIWIRGYPSSGFNGGYNVVVFNQRCKNCNEIAKMTLDKDTYVDRVAYRLRKWAGVKVVPPVFVKKSRIRHDFQHCEGCRLGHCEWAEQDDAIFYASS